MAKTSAQSHSANPSPAQAPETVNPDFVELVAEDGKSVAPPPPEILEPDPELTPEQAEQVRKDYLLTRFWISARGYWGKTGDRLAWVFTIGLLLLIVANVGFQYGINVWNRAIFDAIEKRDSATVYYLAGVFFPLAIGSVLLGVAQVLARMGIQRRWRAWLTSSVMTRWLANGRYYQLNLVGGDLHRRALDHRRRADVDARWIDGHHSRLPGDRGRGLRGDRFRLDHDDR